MTSAFRKIRQKKSSYHLYYRSFERQIRLKGIKRVKNSPAVRVYGVTFFEKTFAGKELDGETGLYYYGARYLDPRISRWLSVDPAMYEGDYLPSTPNSDEARKRNQNLPGMGGIYNYVNFHVYHYGGNNPIKYVDPDGEYIATPWTIASLTIGVASLYFNIKSGNTSGIIVDSLGIAADIFALATGTGGGAGMVIKMANTTRTVSNLAQSAHGAYSTIKAVQNDDTFGIVAGVCNMVSPALNLGSRKAFGNAQSADISARNAATTNAMATWARVEETFNIIGHASSAGTTIANSTALANTVQASNSQQTSEIIVESPIKNYNRSIRE